MGALHRSLLRLFGARIGWALVQNGDHIRTDDPLDLDHPLRRQLIFLPIFGREECDAFVVDTGRFAKAVDLVATAVRHHGVGPSHPAVQPTSLQQFFRSRPTEHVPGIHHEESRTAVGRILEGEIAQLAMTRNGKEAGSLERTVRCLEHADACTALVTGVNYGEGPCVVVWESLAVGVTHLIHPLGGPRAAS